MKHHPEVLSIMHKFCEPGHSTIQEVDNLHSQIERVETVRYTVQLDCCECLRRFTEAYETLSDET